LAAGLDLRLTEEVGKHTILIGRSIDAIWPKPSSRNRDPRDEQNTCKARTAECLPESMARL
jgi:hypothetical protein